MKKLTFLTALFLTIGMIGCRVKKETKPHIPVGGACDYITIKGKATILSIDENPNGIKGTKLVKFHFVPNQKTTYLFPNWSDTSHLVYRGLNGVTENFIKKHNIVVGKVNECVREEITKGTCTPVVFRLKGFDD